MIAVDRADRCAPVVRTDAGHIRPVGDGPLELHRAPGDAGVDFDSASGALLVPASNGATAEGDSLSSDAGSDGSRIPLPGETDDACSPAISSRKS